MQNITSSTRLKLEIQLLELEQAEKKQQLKDEFFVFKESIKPLNLLKNTLKDVVSTPGIIGNLLGTTLGLASGYLSKKVIVGASHNVFRKLIGSILQFGVTNVVAHHPDDIKNIGQSILHRIFHKKENRSKKL